MFKIEWNSTNSSKYFRTSQNSYTLTLLSLPYHACHKNCQNSKAYLYYVQMYICMYKRTHIRTNFNLKMIFMTTSPFWNYVFQFELIHFDHSRLKTYSLKNCTQLQWLRRNPSRKVITTFFSASAFGAALALKSELFTCHWVRRTPLTDRELCKRCLLPGMHFLKPCISWFHFCPFCNCLDLGSKSRS